MRIEITPLADNQQRNRNQGVGEQRQRGFVLYKRGDRRQSVPPLVLESKLDFRIILRLENANHRRQKVIPTRNSTWFWLLLTDPVADGTGAWDGPAGIEAWLGLWNCGEVQRV